MAIEPEMAIDPVDSGDTQRVTKPDGTVQEISTTEDGVETQKTTLPVPHPKTYYRHIDIYIYTYIIYIYVCVCVCITKCMYT
jgi:hypothetical protein